MHFTVVFSPSETPDLSYSLCFVPCPVWMQGNHEIVNLHPDDPCYVPGDFESLVHKIPHSDYAKNIVLVVHPGGHGTEADLNNLTEEIMNMGFKPNVVRI